MKPPQTGLPPMRPQTGHKGQTPQTPRTLTSTELLTGAPLVLIEHQGETYRLQTTRQGKLILTK